MAVGSIGYIVMDTQDPDRIAPFWCGILGTEEESRVGGDQYVLLKAVGGAPSLSLQKVPEAKTIKDRMHLDIGVEDLQVAKAQVLELGGSVLSDTYELEGFHWINVADPEGHEFDIVATRLS